MCRSLFTVLAWGDLAHDEVPSGEAFLKPPAEPDLGEADRPPIMFNISEEDKRTDLMVPEGYKWPDKAKSREPSVDDEAARSLAGAPMLEDPDHRSRASYESSRSGGARDGAGAGASFASTLESADEAASPTRGLADRLARGSRSEAELPSPALPGPESVDPFAGAHPLAYSRSSPALGTPRTSRTRTCASRTRATGAPSARSATPSLGGATRQSSRQRAPSSTARPRRAQRASPRRPRGPSSSRGPPPGVSETALHVFEVDAHSYHSASSMSLTLPKINARPL
ncbi:hypothetical protein JL722_5809 [Aureococcus anophagefferens]|nr:hypothetical protein JL722_5809 [Aureococcus anophagefferens]